MVEAFITPKCNLRSQILYAHFSQKEIPLTCKSLLHMSWHVYLHE